VSLLQETFTARILASPPPEPKYEFRLCYSDRVPVAVWTVWYGETLDEVVAQANKQAALDLRPSSPVTDNVFVVEQFHGGEWDAYDPDGNDLTAAAFGEEE
jgi:hypothetical protein